MCAKSWKWHDIRKISIYIEEQTLICVASHLSMYMSKQRIDTRKVKGPSKLSKNLVILFNHDNKTRITKSKHKKNQQVTEWAKKEVKVPK